MPRGGFREGSGRPKGSGQFKVETTPIRAPVPFAHKWAAGMKWFWPDLIEFYEEKLKGKDNGGICGGSAGEGQPLGNNVSRGCGHCDCTEACKPKVE